MVNHISIDGVHKVHQIILFTMYMFNHISSGYFYNKKSQGATPDSIICICYIFDNVPRLLFKHGTYALQADYINHFPLS